MIAHAELRDVYSLLVEITAALHGLGPDADVTDEQIQNTATGCSDRATTPSKPHRRRRLQISSPQITGMFSFLHAGTTAC